MHKHTFLENFTICAPTFRTFFFPIFPTRKIRNIINLKLDDDDEDVDEKETEIAAVLKKTKFIAKCTSFEELLKQVMICTRVEAYDLVIIDSIATPLYSIKVKAYEKNYKPCEIKLTDNTDNFEDDYDDETDLSEFFDSIELQFVTNLLRV